VLRGTCHLIDNTRPVTTFPFSFYIVVYFYLMVEVHTVFMFLTDRGEAYGLGLDGLLLFGLPVFCIESGFVSKFLML